MYNTIGTKLRAGLVAATYKIHKNRYKDLFVAGKWAPENHAEDGSRTWDKADPTQIQLKILEEAEELARSISTPGGTPKEGLLELGDVIACSMMLADRIGVFQPELLPPKIVCLCGSTKFRAAFEDANFQETMAGNIVLSVGFFMHSEPGRHKPTVEEKMKLDLLHKRKIDLCDEILVINVGNYIGESTRSEIEYATQNFKLVRYWESWTDAPI